MKTQLHRWCVAGMVMAAFFLICSNVFGQDENAKIFKGYRLKPGSAPLEVLGNLQGRPNSSNRYILSSNVYVKIDKASLSYFDYDENDEWFIRADTGKWVKFTVPDDRLINQGSPEISGQSINRRAKGQFSIEINPIPVQLAESQLGMNFWMKIPNLVSLDSLIDEYFAKEYSYSRWSVGLLVVPYKYRFSYKSSLQKFSGESTLGTSITFDLAHDRGYDQRLSLVGGAGITVINPNGYWATDEETLPNLAGASIYGGLVGRIQKTQFGIIYGYDFSNKSWEFDKKPWISIAVGFSFFNPPGEGRNLN